MTNTTKRIRHAEDTLAKARTTLEKAEARLHTAEKVSESLDEARSRPVRKASMVLGLLSIVGLIAFLIQRDTD